jgi:four helix bundle protein
LTLRLVARVPLPFKPIADQAIRATASVPANLAEGHGLRGRHRMHHWRIAYASAKEVDSHLRLLVHASAIEARATAHALDLFDQVRAMVWRLVHPSSE